MINFFCIHCGTQIAAEDQWAGLQSACPNCQQEIDIPSQCVTGLIVETSAASDAPAIRQSAPPLPPVTKRKAAASEWGIHPGFIITGVIALCAFMLLCIGGVIEIPTLPEKKASATERQLAEIQEQLARQTESRSTIAAPTRSRCESCNGSGQVASNANVIRNHPNRLGLKLSNPELFCQKCSGEGTIRTPSGYVGMCGSCGGTGANPNSTCGKCGGSGYR